MSGEMGHTLEAPPSFKVWDAAQDAERLEWIRAWESWPRREVFAHPHYARLGAGPGTRVLCASAETEGGCVLYPFLLRDLSVEPFWPGGLEPASDLVTPYGYGGPFAWGDGDLGRLAEAFWQAFNAWAESQRVASEFVRFTLFDGEILPYPGDRIERASNVVRSLEHGEDELWMDFEAKVRKNVKKARRLGVEIEVDLRGDRIEEFLRLYTGTMDRRGATAQYYFTPEYFEAIHRDLPGQFVYLHATHQGTVVSTELVLVSAENVYSFLGGTDRSAFELSPNDLIKYEIIRWAQGQGKRRFVLGGGYQPNDGIFRYKLAFAPDGRVPFSTGQRVLRRDLYDTLVDRRRAQANDRSEEWAPSPGFFPEYRG